MKRFIPVSLVLLLLMNCATLYLYFKQPGAKKSGFVDVLRLTGGYKLKTDLSKKVEGKLMADKNVLDSLNLIYSIARAGTPEAAAAGQQLMAAKYRYQTDMEGFDRSISEQVWNRLNPLIYQFSTERRLSLLIGASGNGNVLYGDSTLDYTSQLLQYVNERYEGH